MMSTNSYDTKQYFNQRFKRGIKIYRVKRKEF